MKLTIFLILLASAIFFSLGSFISATNIKEEVQECWHLLQDRCTGLMDYASDLEIENTKLNTLLKNEGNQ